MLRPRPSRFKSWAHQIEDSRHKTESNCSRMWVELLPRAWVSKFPVVAPARSRRCRSWFEKCIWREPVMSTDYSSFAHVQQAPNRRLGQSNLPRIRKRHEVVQEGIKHACCKQAKRRIGFIDDCPHNQPKWKSCRSFSLSNFIHSLNKTNLSRSCSNTNWKCLLLKQRIHSKPARRNAIEWDDTDVKSISRYWVISTGASHSINSWRTKTISTWRRSKSRYSS